MSMYPLLSKSLELHPNGREDLRRSSWAGMQTATVARSHFCRLVPHTPFCWFQRYPNCVLGEEKERSFFETEPIAGCVGLVKIWFSTVAWWVGGGR